MSVKVAVRVRPFKENQIEKNCKLVVQMVGAQTIMKAFQKQPERKFTFDYSFWSFDQYKKQDNGYLSPIGQKYSDQKKVFDAVGKKVLDNAYEGYNCCLFAYGQTGSGKSYSMIGYETNKGIVPIACNEIFQRMKTKKESVEYLVHISMLQIYNEQLQDLTVQINQRPTGGLKIRESPALGTYVQKISAHFVQSFQQIEKIMERGSKNRTIAATQMNNTSSRAHTVITITLTQNLTTNGTKTSRKSIINLVDLAGSQRQSKTQATGDRLKQGIGINLSLTTLGQVISILAQNADGANKFVPYRNSNLTRILQNALGGNSQTVMICAISPADYNYEQTLSTLRYADQAKKIKNKPVVNESQTDKLIRQLKAENERLRKMLQERGKGGGGQISNNAPADKTNPNKPQETQQDIAANLQQLSKALQQQLKTKQQRRKQAQTLQNQEEKKEAKQNEGQQKILGERQMQKLQKQKKLPPYLQNISRDIMLNRKLKILLQKKHIRIGKKGCIPPNQIIFGGRDMVPQHATLDTDEGGNVTLTPLSPNIHLYVNGEPVKEKVVLKHLDRIIFGWNSVYLFKDKQHKRENQNELKKSKDIDWQYCKKQVLKHVDIDQSDSEEGGGGCCRIF